jgi:hypothetical protein
VEDMGYPWAQEEEESNLVNSNLVFFEIWNHLSDNFAPGIEPWEWTERYKHQSYLFFVSYKIYEM